MDWDRARAHAFDLYNARRYADAAEACQALLVRSPADARTANLLGIAQLAMGETDAAIRAFSTALAADRDYTDAWNNLGLAFEHAGRPAEAIVVFDKVLAREPDHGNALPLSVFLRQQLCHDWASLDESVARVKRVIHSGGGQGLLPFPLLALPGLDGADHLAAARGFAVGACGAALDAPPLGRPRVGEPERLRIGYLSHDFREHPVCQLFTGVLEHHDHRAFEFVAYSYGPDDGSEMRARVVRACDVFHDVRADSDRAIAERIAADAIDILVDLTGFTTGGRPVITALRPAPIQVTWWGYAGTLGHPRLADYLIGDPTVTPLASAAHFSESLALMPFSYVPCGGSCAPGPAVTRREEGLPEDAVVFCDFNQSYKITPAVFDVWCRLLRAVPGSVLWLLGPIHPAAVRNLFAEAERRSVQRSRLRFARRAPLARHLARLSLADLAVDTFPYGSHTTACDTLRAGVPLVTLEGTTFASRVAASLLRTAGLPELVARSWEDYEAMALALIRDGAHRTRLRASMADGMCQTPFDDARRFARNLEALYRRMWQDRHKSRRPAISLTEGETWNPQRP
jgi:protein O-GlcNAc transferase